MPEEIFWRTMNPARLHALYNAQLLRRNRQAPHPTGKQEDEPRSLIRYLMGGG